MRIFDIEYEVWPDGNRYEAFWDEMDFEVMEDEPEKMFCELIELFNAYCDKNGYIARMGSVTDITEAA